MLACGYGCQREMSEDQRRGQEAEAEAEEAAAIEPDADYSPMLSVAVDASVPGRLRIEFTNNGGREIKLLKPLDGSYWSWTMPYYQFSLSRNGNTDFDLMPRCKLHGRPFTDTEWPVDYVVLLAPGQSTSIASMLPFVIPETGEYELTLKYLFEPPKSGELPAGEHHYPNDIWRGKIESESIRIQLKAT